MDCKTPSSTISRLPCQDNFRRYTQHVQIHFDRYVEKRSAKQFCEGMGGSYPGFRHHFRLRIHSTVVLVNFDGHIQFA